VRQVSGPCNLDGWSEENCRYALLRVTAALMPSEILLRSLISLVFRFVEPGAHLMDGRAMRYSAQRDIPIVSWRAHKLARQTELP
jgi:hypothetical protein